METVTKNYVTDYLSLANRDIMVKNEGQYVQRYVYGADSERISVQVTYADGTQRGQSGENLASDFAANDTEKVWYRRSLLDSTLLAVNKDGEQVVHMSYDAWGNPETETKLDENFAGIDNLNNFTGYTYDETLELYFAQNRFYDPKSHRFTQEDPARDGENWFVYCGSNPLMYVDSWGERNDSIANVISKISDLTVLAKQYTKANGAISTNMTDAHLALQFVRRTRYDDVNWDITAGEIDMGFVNYVKNNNANLFDYFQENICVAEVYSDVKNAFVDLWHFAATADAMLFDSTFASIKSFGVGDDVMNNLAGWAGDLQTLVADIINDPRYGSKASYSSVYNRAYSLLTNPDKESSRFPYSDLLTDADAYNIGKSINLGTSLADAMTFYYKDGYKTRYTSFVNGLAKKGVRDAALRYTTLKWSMTVTWPLYESNKVKKISYDISSAVADAFADVVWRRVESEGVR